MSDTSENTSSTHVIEAELDDMERVDSDTETPKPSQAPASSSGGGFVWLLAFVILIAGGSYAAWPYVGDKLEPYISDARAILGLQARPTEPSLFRPAPHERATAAASTSAPAPTYPPESVTAQQTDSSPQSTSVPETTYAPEEPVAPVTPTAAVVAPAQTQAPVDDLERRISALEAQPAVSASPILDSLSTRLDVLETQLTAAFQQTQNQGDRNAALEATGRLAQTLDELKAEIAALKTRINALETAPRGLIDPTASAQAMVLSVTQLQAQARGDGPFMVELDALERIGASDPVITMAVARLRPHAVVGVPTTVTLANHFKSVAADVMRAHGRSTQNGWWGEVTNKVTGLVTVRRTDPARIDDEVERALAIAEQALSENDLKTAYGAISTLKGAAAKPAQDWHGAAQARVEISEALSILHNHAVTALSAPGGV